MLLHAHQGPANCEMSKDTAIDDFMTPEEKDKLFTAIGYSESTYNLTLPKQLNSKDQGLQKTTNSSLEEIMDKAYDKFDVEIKNVQLLFARADIHVELAKAMIEKDVRTARSKVSGGLPLMHVRISDQKMKDALCLINSIPLPQKSSELFPERQDDSRTASSAVTETDPVALPRMTPERHLVL
ncbi:hypothetical protein MC885_011971 [Smutsia gigantea]|nr:hypothetical protein MC885_011971 [Smutsia gigantea]